MKNTVGLFSVLAVLSGLAGLYYLFTSFIDTSDVETVWQQVAGGTAATAFFALAVAFLLGALIVLASRILDDLDGILSNIQLARREQNEAKEQQQRNIQKLSNR